VYAQCEAAEPFYAGSSDLLQVAVLSANHPSKDTGETGKTDEGAIMMCEESHYDVTLIDELTDLKPFQLVILPDDTVVSPKLKAALKSFHSKGGKLLISHLAGRDAAGNWALDFLPLQFAGLEDKFPTFWRAKKSFWPEMSASDRVIYSQGVNVKPGKGTTVLVDRVLPYFKRTDLTFSSHFQTPPVADTAKHPAVVSGEGFIYFADPIFREYRVTGNTATRDVWRRAVRLLIGEAPVGEGLPTTVSCIPRRRGKDLIVTLLHYIPVRKAMEIDVCEERMSFAGEILRLSKPAKSVRVFGSGEELPRGEDGYSWILPAVKGRLLIEVPGYFR
jgi:hypothetical protein